MTTNKNLPVQLVGASFASGVLAAFIYSRYTQRVRQEASVRGASWRTGRVRTSGIDPISALFNQNEIGVHILNHLTRVYAALGGTTLAGVVGVLVQQRTNFSTSLAGLISLAFAFSLQFQKPQLWKLLAFGLFNGMSLGGLVKLANVINPSIVPIALGSSTLMFTSFAAAATLSTRRSLIYLYGGLGSALSILSLTSLANLFFKSQSLFNLNLYGGLAMFMGYVMADSQLIIERADQGDDDYVSHACLLFTDLSALFSRILVILIQQKAEDEKKRRSRKDKEKGKDEEFYD